MDITQLCELGCMCDNCMQRHYAQGCAYGRPDGYEDYVTECDCDEEEWAAEIAADELINSNKK